MCISVSTVGIKTSQHQKLISSSPERRVYIIHWPIHAALELDVIIFNKEDYEL